MDVKYVADAIVHIAALPLEVTVLEMNIMYVLCLLMSTALTDSPLTPGQRTCRTLGEGSAVTVDGLKSTESGEIQF